MDQFLDLLRQVSIDYVPSAFATLAVAAAVFLVFVLTYHKVTPLLKEARWLWFLQAALFVGLLALFDAGLSAAAAVAPALSSILSPVPDILFWLVGALLLHQVMRLYVWDDLFLRRYGTSPPGLLVGITSALFFVVAAYGIMTFVFDRPVTGLVVSSGIVAGIIGLAMQSSLSDLVAGVAISFERPFKLGDWVELDDGTVGKIIDVNWRATHIRSLHNSIYVIPNARISNARIHNHDFGDPRYRHWVYIHVPSAAPPDLVRRVLLEACLDSPLVLDDPAPAVRVVEAGSSFKYKVFVYFRDFPTHFAGVDDLLARVWQHCAKHGIVPSAITSDVVYRRGSTPEVEEPTPADLIERIPLFSELDEASRQNLVGSMKVHSLPMDVPVVRQGEEGDSLFVVSAGKVRVMIDVPDRGTEEVAKLGVGNYFGEMSLLAGEPRSASVIAHTACQLLEIDKAALAPIFDRHPQLIDTMARQVAERRLNNQALEAMPDKKALGRRINDLAANLAGRIRGVFGTGS